MANNCLNDANLTQAQLWTCLFCWKDKTNLCNSCWSNREGSIRSIWFGFCNLIPCHRLSSKYKCSCGLTQLYLPSQFYSNIKSKHNALSVIFPWSCATLSIYKHQRAMKHVRKNLLNTASNYYIVCLLSEIINRFFLVSHRILGYASPSTKHLAVLQVTKTTFPSSWSGCRGILASFLHGTNSLHLEDAAVVVDSFSSGFFPHPEDLYAHLRQDGGCTKPSRAKKHCNWRKNVLSVK